MRDVTGAIRKKIYEVLTAALSPVPVYYKYVPATVSASSYVIINTINNSDISNKTTAQTETTFQIGIYTKDSQANAGTAADTIADAILVALYPTPGTSIEINTQFQNYGLSMPSDVSPAPFETRGAIFINRFLTFRASVYHR